MLIRLRAEVKHYFLERPRRPSLGRNTPTRIRTEKALDTAERLFIYGEVADNGGI